MRTLLFILTLISTYSTNADKWFIWRTSDRISTQKVIKENLSIINFLPHEFLDKDFVNFYLIDVDNDKDLDIAYNGWSGAEPNCIRFFINKNGKYNNSAFAWGDLKSVTKNENDNFIMNVNLPGCCGDFEIRDYRIETIVSKDSLELNFLEVKIQHESTKPPQELFDKPIDFKVINDTYNLRVTPEIDSTTYFFPGDIPPGNIYMTYQNGDKGKALGQKIDRTGRIWWYVEMEANTQYSRIENDGKIIYPKFIGWMSSRYLEKIK